METNSCFPASSQVRVRGMNYDFDCEETRIETGDAGFGA